MEMGGIMRKRTPIVAMNDEADAEQAIKERHG
jgi:hypothetical protein